MCRSGILIRRATVADTALIAEMGARTFRDTFAAENLPEDMDQYIAANFATGKIRSELKDRKSIFLLLYQDDKPIAYAILRDSERADCVKGPNPIELVRLYVEQSVIGKSYGSALMKACWKEAAHAGYKTIWLDVWEKNHRAIAFYKKWGFIEVDTQDFVLGSDTQNDLIMERSLIDIITM